MGGFDGRLPELQLKLLMIRNIYFLEILQEQKVNVERRKKVQKKLIVTPIRR